MEKRERVCHTWNIQCGIAITVLRPISSLEAMRTNRAVIHVTSGYLPIFQEVMEFKCIIYIRAEMCVQLSQIYL